MSGEKHEELTELVGELFRKNHKQPHLTVSLLRQHWEAVVGPEMAARTYPNRISRETLWINATDGSWAYQLQFLADEILQSVRAFTGSEDITELRFKMGEVPSPAAKEAATPLSGGAPAAAPESGGPAAQTASEEATPAASTAATRAMPPPSGAREPLLPEARLIPGQALSDSFSRWLAGQKKRKLEREGEGAARGVHENGEREG